MREQLMLLIELQKAELETSKINSRRRIIPDEIVKLDDTYKDYQVSVEEKTKKFNEIQKSHREKEEKLKKGIETLKKAKERLGEVKTNKEYQAVLKEIEIIEDKNSETEDEIILLLDAVDKIKDDLRIKEKEMEVYELKYEEERRNFATELDNLEKNLANYSEKSIELRKKIANDLIKQYEAIKALNRGLAVVPVWKEICEGCHMNIPPQLYIEVQRATDLCTCPYCNRIMYWCDQNG